MRRCIIRCSLGVIRTCVTASVVVTAPGMAGAAEAGWTRAAPPREARTAKAKVSFLTRRLQFSDGRVWCPVHPPGWEVRRVVSCRGAARRVCEDPPPSTSGLQIRFLEGLHPFGADARADDVVEG